MPFSVGAFVRKGNIFSTDPRLLPSELHVSTQPLLKKLNPNHAYWILRLASVRSSTVYSWAIWPKPWLSSLPSRPNQYGPSLHKWQVDKEKRCIKIVRLWGYLAMTGITDMTAVRTMDITKKFFIANTQCSAGSGNEKYMLSSSVKIAMSTEWELIYTSIAVQKWNSQRCQPCF